MILKIMDIVFYVFPYDTAFHKASGLGADQGCKYILNFFSCSVFENVLNKVVP
jgi:hypothetical protein